MTYSFSGIFMPILFFIVTLTSFMHRNGPDMLEILPGGNISIRHENISYEKCGRYKVEYCENTEVKKKSFPVKKYNTKENAYNEALKYSKSLNVTKIGETIDISIKEYLKKNSTWRNKLFKVIHSNNMNTDHLS